MGQFFKHYSQYLYYRLYGQKVSFNEEFAFTQSTPDSLLSFAVGVYIAQAGSEYYDILPAGFKAMLESKLIPGLSALEIQLLAQKHAENFYARFGDLRKEKQDERGRLPYELIENAAQANIAFDYFSKLATTYALTTPQDPSDELFSNAFSIIDFLGKQSQEIVIDGDNDIESIVVSSTGANINIIVIGYQNDLPCPPAFAVQVDWAGHIYGISSAYANLAQNFLNFIISKALEGVYTRGLENVPLEEALDESMSEVVREESLDRKMRLLKNILRQKNKKQRRAIKEEEYQKIIASEEKQSVSAELFGDFEEAVKAVSILKVPQKMPEVLFDKRFQRKQRYDIDLPSNVLASISSPVLQRRLRAAIPRVAYSPLGSNVMKKLKGSDNRYRIKFSGHRAFLKKNENGSFSVTGIEIRDDQTYKRAKRRGLL